MIPVNFPNPPDGCTHKLISKTFGCLVYFYDERRGLLYDTQFGEWLSSFWTLDRLYKYIQFNIEPLTVELENK